MANLTMPIAVESTEKTIESRQLQARKRIGRPSKYTRACYATALDYLENYKSVYDEQTPTIAGLAVALGVSRKCIYKWASDETKEPFGNVIEMLHAKQESDLLSFGLAGKFNPKIATLMLCKHGYNDNQQVTGTQVTVNVSRDRVEVDVEGATIDGSESS